MRACVGVTDFGWYTYLAQRPYLTEANFWLPGGGPKNFRVIRPEEAFFFKTHHPHNKLVGAGILSSYLQLPLSYAWDAFREQNGCSSLVEMRQAISRYRKVPIRPDDDPMIGCVMLRDCVFVEPGEGLPAPPDFAKNIVRWKGYDHIVGAANPLDLAFAQFFASAALAVDLDQFLHVRGGPMFGRPRSVAPRLGQGAFAAVVDHAYRSRCAVTGAKIRPALEAAHIVPVTRDGQHRVDNGLLLRADVHKMFDAGYLGVHPRDHALQVSPQLRSTFGNGEEFYARAGTQIALPDRRVERPNAAFLEWHMDAVFRS